MSPPARTVPLDITGSVLERLPTKSMVRFRAVSSSWNSLISDPNFRKIHFNRAIHNPNLSHRRALLSTSTRLMLLDPQKNFSRDGGALVVLDLRSPLAEEDRRLRIIGSCNGLVCLGLAGCRDLFIWNPSTGDCSKLPQPPTPTGWSYAPGFGYDSSSEDYKVVLVTYCSEAGLDSHGSKICNSSYHIVAIYSLKRNSWRIFKQLNEAVHNFQRWNRESFPESMFLNGAIHWKSRTGRGDKTITAFDVSKETFYLVPTPPDNVEIIFENGFGVIGGYLCLVCYNEEGGNSLFELWVMKEYGVRASWTKLIPLLNPDDKGSMWSSKDFYEPLCAFPENTVTLLRNAKELIRFNDRGEILEKACICDDDSDKCEGIVFVESIIAADISIGERDEKHDDNCLSIDDSAKCGRFVYWTDSSNNDNPVSGAGQKFSHGYFRQYF